MNISRDSLELYAKTRIKGWSEWSDIQRESEEKAVDGSALLIAPTGAGKTEAAVLWALRNRKGGERIFYVLPYQVSINSMAERLSEFFHGIIRPGIDEQFVKGCERAQRARWFLEERRRDFSHSAIRSPYVWYEKLMRNSTCEALCRNSFAVRLQIAQRFLNLGIHLFLHQSLEHELQKGIAAQE